MYDLLSNIQIYYLNNHLIEKHGKYKNIYECTINVLNYRMGLSALLACDSNNNDCHTPCHTRN